MTSLHINRSPKRERRISEMRFSLEPVSRVRAAEMVGIVHHGLVDPETKRSLGAGPEKTREPEEDAGHAPDHPLFT